MNQKISLLESSIDFLKEKFKAGDYAKSLLENRISAIQNRMLVMLNGTNKVEKQNLTNFDTSLTNSHTFTNSLKKVDANVTANLRKLEEYFGGLIMESQTKFGEIQEKLIGMMTQKQKILRHLNFQIQNHGHSIAAIQEWIKNDHQQTNSIQMIEQNLRQKIEYMQKNNEMKMQVLEEKMKYLQQLKDSTNGYIKNLSVFRQEINDSLQNLRKQSNGEIKNLKINLKEIQSNITGKQKGQTKGNIQSLQDQIGNIKKKINSFGPRIDDIEDKNDRVNRKLTLLQEKINDTTFKSSNSPQDKNIIYQNETLERKYSGTSQKKNNNYQSNNYGRKNSEQKNLSKNLFNQTDKKGKKQLPPPRRNLLEENTITTHRDEQEIANVQMRGGIRGLLQKSKQKDRDGLLKTNDPLGRQNSLNRRGLPPVKQDPLAKKKKTQSNNIRHQKQEEEQAVVYQIDEQGYLMDENGNYLLDQNGAMIKLSPEQIEEYMMDEQQY